MKELCETEVEFLTVQNLLSDAQDCGLETEVIIWALKEMKKNPLLTVAEAMTLGYDEWVK